MAEEVVGEVQLETFLIESHLGKDLDYGEGAVFIVNVSEIYREIVHSLFKY